ncbi:class I SAM-dependent methyltransferase [bacterium]|nr:class I SAM-dependent methyltransferase [bacterium]
MKLLLSDYDLWEERYNAPGRKLKEPEPFVVSCSKYLYPGRVLDIACGEGRHSLYVANLGAQFEVWGIDRSPTAIDFCQRAAKEGNLNNTNFLVCDLEKEPLPSGLWENIIVTRYWQEELCAQIISKLVPGGVLIYETYTVDYLRYGERNRKHLLQPGQLKEAFAKLKILNYSEADRPQTREYSARLLAVKD